MGLVGGLLLVCGLVDAFVGFDKDKSIFEKIIHFASAILFIVGAIMIWLI